MMTDDDALKLGLKKYREIYPLGAIPKEIEERALLSELPSSESVSVQVAFGILNRTEPILLFKARIDRNTGEIAVEVALDWKVLLGANLDPLKEGYLT